MNVFPVTIPPLRARKDDVDALADFFLQRFARELGKPALRISGAARASLRGHDWPGNIRELENCIERAAILCDHNTIEPHDVSLGTSHGAGDALREAVDLSGTLADAMARATQMIERVKIEDALRRTSSLAGSERPSRSTASTPASRCTRLASA